MMRVITLMMLMVSAVQAQEIRLAVWQDARLAITEDATGNYKPFTVDVYAKLKLIGNQSDAGHLVVSPTFEYADLEGVYKRYAVDVGYCFDQSVIDGLEVTASINYGILDRWSKAWLVFGADLESSYEISDGLHLSILGQAVDRKDLLWAYSNHKIGLSGFIGVQYRIFNTKTRRK